MDIISCKNENSVNPVIKFLKFLIKHIVPCILTKRYCQDLLENYASPEISV